MREGLEVGSDEYNARYEALLPRFDDETKAEGEKVRALGGLYVLGTERHESRRIDNQLRGRSGRQGDPGESRFYLSLGDELMVRFNGARIAAMMNLLRMPEDTPLEYKQVTKAIQSAQAQVEAQNFEIRKDVLKYDEVMNKQRTVIYDERKRVLDGEDLSDQVQHMLTDVITAYTTGASANGATAEDWDLDQLWTSLKQLYPVGITIADLDDEVGGRHLLEADYLHDKLLEDARRAYEAREEELTSDAMREVERLVLLQVIDRKWREHLYEMDYLQEGIGLRAHAQRDPLVEYQREGYNMFSQMLEGIKEEVVGFLFNLEVRVEEAPPPPAIDPSAARLLSAPTPKPIEVHAKGLGKPQPRALQYSSPTIDGEAGSGGVAVESAPALGIGRGPTSARAAGAKMPAPGQVVGAGGPSRNAPCPCGSGKKYKRCHGSPEGM
jgi:preprotein translocase subunit SecA